MTAKLILQDELRGTSLRREMRKQGIRCWVLRKEVTTHTKSAFLVQASEAVAIFQFDSFGVAFIDYLRDGNDVELPA